ncbi:hypothetical protein LTR91_023410 [Friedmanniomyces endolithicus]|uniref:Expansin-like EG45 domain-containing protein n=1 Tax=Friedmanniomyces endolithicus TaxID=329885 RepID=A0AAN6H3E8_9PEZI|nr:hypothetical protein LTS02_012112 [Friedmanniomyces endolithicus]KAK0880852.1 hypothetical protein LTR87_005345 [Friedmanniomyces endolithicus]KAK0906003.1 hypothetical protein LTR57_017989 [Friedmanniomyces endolithicus]KAK0951881.1 hypothetical protein LTS01_025058 [Friedmanniomyces endolithicus]KAK0954262.1 hypothetical protein LTR91_023410 [Friedmanniomyces endolithicus]
MLAQIFSLLALAVSATLAAPTAPTSLDQRAVARRSLSGQATFYGGNVHGGTCSFSTYTLPSGLYGTALSDSNWDDAGNCGGCVAVTYGGKTVTAMIVDECPGCGTNHLDLFPTAFSALASPSAGVIDVTWDYVPCPVTGPLQIHMKSGVSEYWFSAQVVNAHRRTSKMEVSTNQGASWTTATRMTYNFFEISSGIGANSAWIRLTSQTGTMVVVKNVPMTSDAIVTAGGNYA